MHDLLRDLPTLSADDQEYLRAVVEKLQARRDLISYVTGWLEEELVMTEFDLYRVVYALERRPDLIRAVDYFVTMLRDSMLPGEPPL